MEQCNHCGTRQRRIGNGGVVTPASGFVGAPPHLRTSARLAAGTEQDSVGPISSRRGELEHGPAGMPERLSRDWGPRS
jgi:hypothetical protein